MLEQIKLSRLETSLYFIVWSGAVLYSIYNLYLKGNYFDDYNDVYGDFGPGWSILSRKVDISDEEWRIWMPFILRLLPWYFVHVAVSQMLKYLLKNTTVLCCWYIFISIVFLWRYVGILGIVFALLQPCLSCLLISFRSKLISWLVHSVMLILINWAKFSNMIFRDWLELEDEEFFMFSSAICWIQIRSISYDIDSIDKYDHIDVGSFLKDFLQNIAYCLYLPTLFLGPILLYKQFVDGLYKPYQKWTVLKVRRVILNLIRYIFWMYFTEFAMHFIYCNALQYHPEEVKRLSPWAFFGLGYCMGQNFLNKYVVVYGISSTVCRADDIQAPTQPKCVGRIHLYSEMWKHFDRGLYNFLVKYIYVPTCKSYTPLEKIKASFLCFSFVFMWHGMQLFIFIWAVLNFLGLTMENLAKHLAHSSKSIKKFLHNYLSPRNKRRFECVISSPHLAFSAVTNFYFFAGLEIGNIYMLRLFYGSWYENAMLLIALYCCCQVSTEVKQFELKKKDRKILKDSCVFSKIC